jgi:DNA-damage-inducible protein J
MFLKGNSIMSTSTLQVRLDTRLKKDADQFFSAAGLDITTAVRMFLRQVVIRQNIPFDIIAEDPFYSTANQSVLKKSIRQLEAGKGKARTPQRNVRVLESPHQ